jgi:hypothetical protein
MEHIMGTPAAYSWIPSTARVIVLDAPGILPRGSRFCATPVLDWPPKDPTDTLDFTIDISQIVAGNEGDAIATLDVVISPDNPGDLTLNASSADGDLAILWLSAGFADIVYAVTVTIGTNSGRIIGRTINLPVLALAMPPIPPQALTDQSGNPITDQTDSPITATP